MLLCVILDAVLHIDHAVHEAERLEGDIVSFDDVDAFTDSAQRITAVADDCVSDLLCELRVAHSGAASQSAVDPLLVRVSEGVQLLYGLCLLSLCCHMTCRKIVVGETFELWADTRILVFRDKCGFHIVRASVFSLSPYGGAASAAPHNRALLEVELVSRENLPADVLGDEYGGAVLCVCPESHLEHEPLDVAGRIAPIVHDIGGDEGVSVLQRNSGYMDVYVRILNELIFFCASEVTELHMDGFAFGDSLVDCVAVFLLILPGDLFG